MGAGSEGAAPSTSSEGAPKRRNAPSGPESSTSTGPAQAPRMMQIAAPENQVTSDRATPKKPNCRKLLVTLLGIQSVADTAYAAIARPVTAPVATSTRIRTCPISISQAVSVHTATDVASATIAKKTSPIHRA